MTSFPDDFLDFLEFLCSKYDVDRNRTFVEYSSKPPPLLQGGMRGYYDGLLSYRQRNGRSEFLITVFTVARDPLLTLGHAFDHLVEDLASGRGNKRLGPPDDEREKKFDDLAYRDLAEFHAKKR